MLFLHFFILLSKTASCLSESCFFFSTDMYLHPYAQNSQLLAPSCPRPSSRKAMTVSRLLYMHYPGYAPNHHEGRHFLLLLYIHCPGYALPRQSFGSISSLSCPTSLKLCRYAHVFHAPNLAKSNLKEMVL